ncbi:hypothetical protein AJ80_04612 [Polytolypa hystricis UAMH7299]|uniref:Signal recognition particle receptor subunit beta n=1 Tax=Polytolypa hystricis (strain UAMH7299) TaxID=1447883 RepID=A0A2B7YAA9_POLH7|nr:hypothetical protein AJ80_04612 [Polytolypa hystricis UAMH7299]
MAWSTVEKIATTLLSGNIFAIVLTIIVAFGLPILLHFTLYRSAVAQSSTDFLLLGPSGSGKTALCSLLEQRSRSNSDSARQTHTSQDSSSVPVTLPSDVPTRSNRYRSVNDPSLADAKRHPARYFLLDTPGHGKLRDSQAISKLQPTAASTTGTKKAKANSFRGVVFMIDAAELAEDYNSLRDAAGYLHDTLLTLQRRVYRGGKRLPKKAPDTPVLVAANKQDLFAALPAGSVRERLEAEIEKIRHSKRRGLLDASVNPMGGDEEEQEMLGGDEIQAFTFAALQEETGVKVDVVGGAVKGDGADGVRRWEEWVGMCL